MTDAILIDRHTSYELQGFQERHEIKEDRKPTNVPFLALLLVVFVIWVANATYVLSNTKLSYSELRESPTIPLDTETIKYTNSNTTSNTTSNSDNNFTRSTTSNTTSNTDNNSTTSTTSNTTSNTDNNSTTSTTSNTTSNTDNNPTRSTTINPILNVTSDVVSNVTSIIASQANDTATRDAINNFPSSFISAITSNTTDEPEEKSSSILDSQNYNAAGAILLSACFILAYIYLVSKMLAKVIVYIGVFLIGLLSVFLVVVFIGLIILGVMFSNFMYIFLIAALPLIFLFIFDVALIQSAENAGMKLMVGIVKESCRTILHHPTTLLFSLLILSLEAFVYKFWEMIIRCTIALEASNTLIYTSHVINAIGAFYLYFFISYFGYTVVATTIATCHWNKNREEPSKCLILSSIARTTRYHLGSICFGATRVLPFIQGLYLNVRTKCNASQRSGNLLVRIFARIILIFDVSAFALIQTSIDGSGSKISYAKIFQLVSSNSSLYLVISSMKLVVTYFMATLAFTISSTMTQFVLQRMPTERDEGPLALSFMQLYFIIPFYGLLYTSTKTILLCTMLDLEDSSTSFLDTTA